MARGRIAACFRKTAAGRERVGDLIFQAGIGIAGDVHAFSTSPRQVLLQDSGTLRDFGLDAGGFQENLTLDFPSLASLPSGTLLRVGKTAVLRLTFLCEPCGKLAASLRAEGSPKTIKDAVRRRGYLATVLHSGTAKPGDSIEDGGVGFAPVPEKLEDRVRWLVAQIPRGKVVTYLDVVHMVGAFKGNCRAFPIFLKRAVADGLPAHRVLDGSGSLIAKHLPKQEALLAEEGVIIDAEAQRSLARPAHELKEAARLRWNPDSALFEQRVATTQEENSRGAKRRRVQGD